MALDSISHRVRDLPWLFAHGQFDRPFLACGDIKARTLKRLTYSVVYGSYSPVLASAYVGLQLGLNGVFFASRVLSESSSLNVGSGLASRVFISGHNSGFDLAVSPVSAGFLCDLRCGFGRF